MKHYIPTLDETARAILEDDDYSLYKRRRQLIEDYSTGTPIYDLTKHFARSAREIEAETKQICRRETTNDKY
jgi:hypothetical protein